MRPAPDFRFTDFIREALAILALCTFITAFCTWLAVLMV